MHGWAEPLDPDFKDWVSTSEVYLRTPPNLRGSSVFCHNGYRLALERQEIERRKCSYLPRLLIC